MVDFVKTPREGGHATVTVSRCSNTVSWLTIAHAIRASLLASAHATTQECRRVSIARVQSATRPDCLSSRSMNARAHWTNRWRIFLSPRLEIPSRVDLPPVLYCLGTSPTAAAKSRLHRYCFQSPRSEARRLAVMGPTPGIVNKRCPRASSESCR